MDLGLYPPSRLTRYPITMMRDGCKVLMTPALCAEIGADAVARKVLHRINATGPAWRCEPGGTWVHVISVPFVSFFTKLGLNAAPNCVLFVAIS